MIFSQEFSLELHISIINCLLNVFISMFDKIQNVIHWKLNSLLVPSFLLLLLVSVSQWMLPLDSKCTGMPPQVHPCPFPPSQQNHQFVPGFHPPPRDPWALALVCLDWLNYFKSIMIESFPSPVSRFAWACDKILARETRTEMHWVVSGRRVLI